MLHHRFVEFIPDSLDEGILYISIDYCTAIHKCVCGCGNKVVTPISPTGWQISFNGRSVSLKPSIGNWNFDCQSHYWIENNKIRHAGQWSFDKIKAGRKRDAELKNEFYLENAPRLSIDIKASKLRQKMAAWRIFMKFIGL